MRYDPSTPKKELIAEAKYVCLCVRAKSGWTQKGDEKWDIHYKLLAVVDTEEEKAVTSIGSYFSDRLIDMSSLAFRWDQFLPVMFPEIKEAGEEAEVHAEHCIGRLIIIRIGIKDGNPQYNEPDKINRAYGYQKFEGDPEPYMDDITKATEDKRATESQDPPPQKEAPPKEDLEPEDTTENDPFLGDQF